MPGRIATPLPIMPELTESLGQAAIRLLESAYNKKGIGVWNTRWQSLVFQASDKPNQGEDHGRVQPGT